MYTLINEKRLKPLTVVPCGAAVTAPISFAYVRLYYLLSFIFST